jgi:hypothetical protein
MNATNAQAKQLRDAVAVRLRFFHRLVERMNLAGFVPDDKLMKAAIEARDAVHRLHVEAHYASCPSGVGEDSE